MVTQTQQQILLTFFEDHPTAVLATSDVQGNPAAAVVLFAEQDDLGLIFGTHPTRKYNNIKANPKVALAMSRGMQAVQYHGFAEELMADDLVSARELFAKKHPAMDQQMVEGSIYFRITPTWIRYMNMQSTPWEQWEVQFPEPDWFHK